MNQQQSDRPLHLDPHLPTEELVMRWLGHMGSAAMNEAGRIELFQLLSARYGGALSESLVSMTLQQDADDPEVWTLTVTKDDGEIDVTPMQLEAGDLPMVLTRFLDSCDGVANAHEYGLFNESALALMERLSKREEWAEEDGKEKGLAVADFYLRCAKTLARHVASKTDLEAEAIALLKSMPATGLRDGEDGAATTRWGELVREFSGGNSTLSDLWRSEVENAAFETFEKQPFPVRLACWIAHETTGDIIGEYMHETPPGKEEDIKLHDAYLIADEVANNVASLAMNDGDR